MNAEKKAKIEAATHTKSGKKITTAPKYNEASGTYLGAVEDDRNWVGGNVTGCQWNKAGKCINRNRPDCDIL